MTLPGIGQGLDDCHRAYAEHRDQPKFANHRQLF